MHKTIFQKANDFRSNPISEFNKIQSFITRICCYEDRDDTYTIYELYRTNFRLSKILTPIFKHLDSCIDENIGTLIDYSNSEYQYLPEETQEKIIDEFRTYCEILLHMHEISMKQFEAGQLITANLEIHLFNQSYEMINKSLLSIGYKVVPLEDENNPLETIPINTIAEVVATSSKSLSIKECIIKYLGVRKNDLKSKENYIKELIGFIYPKLKNGQMPDIQNQIRGFTRIYRHKGEKEEEKLFKWYYDNPSDYIDDLFMLLIYTELYETTKNTIKGFSALRDCAKDEN